MSRIALLLGFLLMVAAPASAADVTTCDTTVPPGEVADLQADLVCAATETGVLLGSKSTLRMNGHSISGGDTGIGCSQRCLIEGPGEIFGTNDGVVLGARGAVLHDLNVHDTAFSGISSF